MKKDRKGIEISFNKYTLWCNLGVKLNSKGTPLKPKFQVEARAQWLERHGEGKPDDMGDETWQEVVTLLGLPVSRPPK